MLDLYQYLIERATAGDIAQQVAIRIIKLLKQHENVMEDHDVAIIGLAARFPGAEQVGDYWNILREGIDCTGSVPDSRRKDLDLILSDPNFGRDRDEYNLGAYLTGIDCFDYPFFRLSPREAGLMDPNQRLFIQSAWQALEDAGYGGGRLPGSRTGVYVGFSSDFGINYKWLIQKTDPSAMGLAVPGNIKSIIASRISYFLDLKGPSILVDTACSSSLIAVHLACRGIRGGECELALAGGVKLNLLPVRTDYPIGIESADGRARTFDEASDGTGLGEGVGVVLLKPLKKALEDRDRIYAVIKGGAANQDGNTIGITAPNSAAQEDVIIRAWRDAGIDPETISYIEAHGTGTKLGDPIEIEGLTRAFRKYTSKNQFCAVGSVKTNIGHLDNAAGIAGLIKAVLALKNRELPPTLHFSRPNRKINFENSPVYVNDRLTKWETTEVSRRCGVSSFGLSGTNCHLVLEEAPVDQTEVPNIGRRKWNIFTLSAMEIVVLEELLGKYQELLSGDQDLNLDALCYTANTGRGHHRFRLALILKDQQDFQEKIQRLNRCQLVELSEPGIFYGEHQLIPDPNGVNQTGKLGISEKQGLDRQAKLKSKDLLNAPPATTGEILTELCQLYVKGADLDWTVLYEDQNYRKISLPVYPFARHRCWVEPDTQKSFLGMADVKVDHPLFDFQLESLDRVIYGSEFRINKQWELKEHKVGGYYIVPGTAYLEMVLMICKKHFLNQMVELRDVVFVAPMVVEEVETRGVQTIISTGGDQLDFNIISRSAREQNWIKHTEGRIVFHNTRAVQYDLDSIKQNCSEEKKPQKGILTGIIETGPRWNSFRKAYFDQQNVLAFFELPREYWGDLQFYELHPSLMDAAVNMGLRNVGDGTFLPFSYKKIRFYGVIPEKIYSYVRKADKNKESQDLASFDITIMDEQGKALVEIEGYTIKKVLGNELKKGVIRDQFNFYHEIGWVPEESASYNQELKGGLVLIFMDQLGLGEKVRLLLTKARIEAIEVAFGKEYRKINQNQYLISGNEEDYLRLISDLKTRGLSSILHLQTMTTNEGIDSLDDLEESLRRGVYSLFYLIRALLQNRVNELELVLVSDYVQAVTNKEARINPHHAAFFGLGKVVSQEYDKIKCKCVDIDQNVTADDLISELAGQDRIFPAAYRNGKRYIQEFHDLSLSQAAGEFPLKNQGVYLITGGTGGIGLEIGKYLALQGKVNLCLVSRSRLPDYREWDQFTEDNLDRKRLIQLQAIREMEMSGAAVSHYAVDLSVMAEVEQLLKELRKKYGRINGIIHCAGLAGDGFLIRKEEEVFRRVLAPKVNGTWILDYLTREDSLDFLVLFSSVTSITGGAGQGDYTAANSYLDSFASYRNKKGKRTLVINWPAWDETGMAVNYGAITKESWFKPLTTVKALLIFEEVMKSNSTVIIPGELNYHLFSSFQGDFPIRVSDHIKIEVEKYRNPMKQRLQLVKEDRRPGLVRLKGRNDSNYSETERRLGQIWAGVLGFSEIDIDTSFNTMGGDSILATRLAREFEKEYPEQLDITDIFSYPTIAQLAAYLDQKLKVNQTPASFVKDVPRIDLSEEDLQKLLAELKTGKVTMENALGILGEESGVNQDES